MGGYFANAGLFLVDLVFGLYLTAVMLRLLLQLTHANFYNPISQAVVTVTNPPLRWLRRWVPPARQVDSASIVLLLAVQLLHTFLILWITRGGGSLPGILLLSFVQLLQHGIYLYLCAIIVLVIVSWVAAGNRAPVLDLLHSLCRPLLMPAQRLLPPMAGLDLSPLLVIVALQLMLMLVVAPLRDIAWSLL